MEDTITYGAPNLVNDMTQADYVEMLDVCCHTSERTSAGTIYTISDTRFPSLNGVRILSVLEHGKVIFLEHKEDWTMIGKTKSVATKAELEAVILAMRDDIEENLGRRDNPEYDKGLIDASDLLGIAIKTYHIREIHEGED